MAPASKRTSRARPPKRVNREYLNVTVGDRTIERVDALALAHAISRGRVVDAAIAHFMHDMTEGSIAFCSEPGCARMRPSLYEGAWRCEEHEA